MVSQASASVESNFTGGLKTEFTGLNFPENACTQTENCVFTLIGDVLRRAGYDYESNYVQNTVDRTNKAISTYEWNNAGGDGNTKILVTQIGNSLYFYKSSSATAALPLSTTILVSVISISDFLPLGVAGGTSGIECQFTDGNGYLFVFHPGLEPFYCIYSAGTVTAKQITVQIRDFAGIPETGVPDDFRPGVLTSDHNYNLQNQGWTSGNPWGASGTSGVITGTGNNAFTVPAGIVGVVIGSTVSLSGDDGHNLGYQWSGSGTVISYAGTTLTINVTGMNVFPANAQPAWSIRPISTGYITTWFSALSTYPSNSDIWWEFKNASGVFDPTTMISKVSVGSSPAPKGSFILDAFNQTRSAKSGISSLTDVTTQVRPKTGTWFQGRVWYSGVDASFTASGDQPYSTWSENIYFSQVITNVSQFGKCYQVNDPTNENLFDLLPTDGGVIQIQGCGSIYRLFPVQNGLIVFAANGIWFIGGSQGVGFAATDYFISNQSSVQSISGTSFVNVLGYPMFWNEEGIYYVSPAKQGGSVKSPDISLSVDNLCLGTILSFYADIPLQSKKFVRGDYNALDFVVTWVYRDTNEAGITSRYELNSALNLNTSSKAFYSYNISSSTTSPYVHAVNYVVGPGGSTSPPPTLKYLTSQALAGTYKFTFSEEKDLNYVDWETSGTPLNFDSNFITGYKLHGKALFKWQPTYVYMFSRADVPTAYRINSIWDYANSSNSGRFSSEQLITNALTNFGMIYRRHKLRGHGLALQIQIASVDGKPFNIMGWSILEQIGAGP